MHKLLVALLLVAIVTDDARAGATRVTIGVLVGEGEHNTLQHWSPTADYLTQKIPGHQFVIVPLNREGIRQAVAHDELDFLLTDPGQYADLAIGHGIVALATIRRAWRDKSYPMFGATIITRADRRDILWLSQIKGKSFMAVSRNDFDGFQLSWWELKAHDIDPFNDFSSLIFSGLSPEEIIRVVRKGSVDAATVRAGILERMASEGKIDLKEFRILHQHVTPEYAFSRSTELYPDWPFAKLRGTSDELAQQVADALQAIPADDPAARSGEYAGWTAPLDYQPVHELLWDLRLSPYQDSGDIFFADIFRQYRGWLIAGLAFLLMSIGFTVYVLWMNRRLRFSKNILETQMAERARAEQALRRSDSALRELHDITATHALPIEGKAQALLGMGCQQFSMPIGILARIEDGRYKVVEAMPSDGPIAAGDVFPTGKYCCNTLQSGEPVCFELSGVPGEFSHPVRERYALEACLGIQVETEGAIYGTLNFIGPKRQTRLSNSDREILKLMAQWLGREIERDLAHAWTRRLSRALEQTADAVMIVNCTGLIEYVNPAFEKITGYAREESVGQNPRILKSGRHDEEFYRRLWEAVQQGEVFRDTFINRRRDGQLYYEEKTITPLKDEQGIVTHFVSTSKDITRRKLAEERSRQRRMQLAHVQRVSAMGTMATSLAHELNQPLAAIVNYARGCIHRLRSGEMPSTDFMTALEQIAAEGNRSGEIIRRVREFLRKGKPLRTRVDINQIVREAADLASPEARQKNIALRLELTDDLPPVLADAVQIEQVVLNLVHNAIEAIDEGHCPCREVTIQTGADQKKGVEVIVRDTGPGLPVKNSDRLFAPFFSTRSNGMGMGLSISRSIVEAHGDHLRALSSTAGGAVFSFALPAAEQGALQ